MIARKSTAKLLFVLLLLLAAGLVPVNTEAKPFDICFDSCDALDAACRAIGATPIACLDTVPVATHICATLTPPNVGPYVIACQAQGGTVTGSSGGAGICTKTCLE
jgi:hypothetical protein